MAWFGQHSCGKLSCNSVGNFRIKLKQVSDGAVHTNDADMRLVRQTDEMGENSDLRTIRLHLAEHDIADIQRGSNGLQISLLARKPQNLGVTDNAVTGAALIGHLFDNSVRQRVS